jgi:uracil-DNA glycosylase
MSLFDGPQAPPAATVLEPLNFLSLRQWIGGCRACELWEHATQAVPGEGPTDGTARLMLVGEQPGDREDIEGRPFVGPAGRILDHALEGAGIERSETYVTNVVKHFRFNLRGTRRIHQTPDRVHVLACQPWLRAELALVKPQALVCLGATAARALLGSHVRIGRDRGQLMESSLAEFVTLTTHPSAILRQRAGAEREAAMNELVGDLSQAAAWLARNRPGFRRP